MEEAIKQFNTQFAWKPKVVNKEKLPALSSSILNGMGGSHLAADFLRAYRPDLDISIFSDYGLPALPGLRLKNALLIASSFSGNTEEALDFAKKALAAKLPLAIIAKGGVLLAFAIKHGLPHVVLPATNIQPRSGLGYQVIALATLIGDRTLLAELEELTRSLKPNTLRTAGKALAQSLYRKVPVIYASAKNTAIAYNWKIKLNETGKIPAFYNVFPELNHNEMTGFDVIPSTKHLSRNLHFVFLADKTDHPQIKRRMKVCTRLYKERGFSVTEVPFTGKYTLQRMCESLLIADWTALHLSELYGTEADQVPMVEEFKRLVSS
jgi:glucose/mannose-6-phosphate isomerase